jgi:hypothetical protein
MDTVHFLNVDLEILSREPLDSLAADLGDDVVVLYCGATERDFLCALIEGLGSEARSIWKRALARSFDVGYESGSSPRFVSTLREETVKRVAALDGEIVITIYPPA